MVRFVLDFLVLTIIVKFYLFIKYKTFNKTFRKIRIFVILFLFCKDVKIGSREVLGEYY